MTLRRAAIVPFALAFALGAASCSKDPQKPPAADTGTSSAECTTGDDCVAGDCLDGLCVWCTDSTCAQGSWCSHNGKCLPCDGGCSTPSGVDASIPLDAGTSCSSRAQCSGLACREGLCGPQEPDGGCATLDECIAGNACTGGACVAGCTTNADCVGAAGGPRCDTSAGRCGPCASSADCDPATENCLGGKCLKATACPGGDRAPCLDLACISELCRPCTTGTDCGMGFDCKTGGCMARASCSDDAQCKTLSPGHWCDNNTGLCMWGCVTGTNCANCCTGKQVCNTTNHQCESPPCNDCGGTCIPPQTCDATTCTCVSPALCDTSCGCPTGKKCDCGGFCISYLCALPTAAYVCK